MISAKKRILHRFPDRPNRLVLKSIEPRSRLGLPFNPSTFPIHRPTTDTMPNTSLRKPQKGFRRGGKVAYHGGRPTRTFAAASGRSEATASDEKWERTQMAHAIDEKMGFERIDSGKTKEGWLVNLQATSIPDERNMNGRAAVDCYFIEDGNETTFKATVEYEPYFLIAVRKGHESEVEEWVKRLDGGGIVKSVKRVDKEDLSMPNHLLGYRRTFLKLSFLNVPDLMLARREIMPIAERNRKNMNAMDTYAEVVRYVIKRRNDYALS